MQNLASIQPRTSLVKRARSPFTDPPGKDLPAGYKVARLPDVDDVVADLPERLTLEDAMKKMRRIAKRLLFAFNEDDAKTLFDTLVTT